MSHPHRTWFRRLEPECEAVRETISAELDGEVSEIEAAFARRHRAECADCEQFALSVAHTTDVLRAAPPVQPSRRLMPAPARVVSRGLAVAGLASRATSNPAKTHQHEIVVAKGNSRDALAREQMLIRQMLHNVRTLDRQPGHERLG
jgi:hypothetical protein